MLNCIPIAAVVQQLVIEKKTEATVSAPRRGGRSLSGVAMNAHFLWFTNFYFARGCQG